MNWQLEKIVLVWKGSTKSEKQQCATNKWASWRIFVSQYQWLDYADTVNNLLPLKKCILSFDETTRYSCVQTSFLKIYVQSRHGVFAFILFDSKCHCYSSWDASFSVMSYHRNGPPDKFSAFFLLHLPCSCLEMTSQSPTTWNEAPDSCFDGFVNR
jgi:hypothetical protein